MGGRAYPVRHYPVAIRLRDRKGRAILCIALNPQNGDFSGAILEVPFKALLHVVNALAKMPREDLTMDRSKPISITSIKANGRIGQSRTVHSFRMCNCLQNKNLVIPSDWRTGNRYLSNNSNMQSKEKSIMQLCADS